MKQHQELKFIMIMMMEIPVLRKRLILKTERTAIIDIIERNFNADDVNINVTSTDDILPDISDWTIVGGTASNGDDTIHRATIHYYADGDYTFDISYADMAGNVADNIEYSGLAPQQFTIDSILPVISVAYDNNDAINGNYYNQARTATVTIEEHNFETSRIVAENNNRRWNSKRTTA